MDIICLPTRIQYIMIIMHTVLLPYDAYVFLPYAYVEFCVLSQLPGGIPLGLPVFSHLPKQSQ